MIGAASDKFRKKLATIYAAKDTTAINKNFGMVITSELSVAINGTNFVIENATHPQIKVAKSILEKALKKSLSNIEPLLRLCKINSKITISIRAPTDCAIPSPSTPQPVNMPLPTRLRSSQSPQLIQ